MADRDLNDRTTAGTAGTAGSGDLRRLSDLKDYEVADGYPDIRGWKVRTPDGRVLGKVDDLVVSVAEMRVRYLDVDVDHSVRSAVADAANPRGAEPGHALVPVGTAQLDDAKDDVVVNSLTGNDLSSYPMYARTGGITREYEQALRGHLGAGTTGAEGANEFYAHEQYDDSRFFGGRARTDRAAATTTDPTSGLPLSREGRAGEGGFLRRRDAAGAAGATGGMGAGAADRATSSGPLDRLADKADNLKDRVDGNPASRPGPDATDRPI